MKKLSGLALVLALTLVALLGPARTSSASPCTDLCYSENFSCKLDCRFTPYPGCLTDCANELQACLAAC
jgi:hypothetical protein